MKMIKPMSDGKLAAVAPADRILLLPHCLRPSETCPGTYSKQGLVCPEDCSQPCAIRIMREAAVKLGYKGVCVAPGGSMALRFVKQMNPKGIVAVACEKELELGIHGVESLVQKGEIQMPVIGVIPLSKDGCVDTEVDVEQALKTIGLVEEAVPTLT
ncbi:MAG: hypothetical protein DRI26_07490 [Chloroflexi bacterium]|nr:MAG: hypothetical protein DRI26_07490 [Chloroflexota bacterium]